MKNFNYVHENYSPTMSNEEYLNHKREVVLKTIKPICEAFEIYDYDYIIKSGREYLQIEGTRIGCTMNSIGATTRQLITYIWLKTVFKYIHIEGSNEKIEKTLKKYWLEV